MDISFIVLVGGKSTRLGRDKIKEVIGDKTLLQRVISSISGFDTEILLITAGKESVPGNITYPRIKTASDIYPGNGSLGGIYSGVVHSKSFYNLVVAGDMPFINRNLLKYMIQVSEGFDVVVPRLGKILEPLHAIYSKNCIGPMEDLLNQGELQIFQFFPQVKIRYVETAEIDKYDPRHLSFFNINNEADLSKAKSIVSKGEY